MTLRAAYGSDVKYQPLLRISVVMGNEYLARPITVNGIRYPVEVLAIAEGSAFK